MKDGVSGILFEHGILYTGSYKRCLWDCNFYDDRFIPVQAQHQNQLSIYQIIYL